MLENDRLEATTKDAEPPFVPVEASLTKAKPSKERVKPKKVAKNTAKYRRKAR
jgi:hypothetical protein